MSMSAAAGDVSARAAVQRQWAAGHVALLEADLQYCQALGKLLLKLTCPQFLTDRCCTSTAGLKQQPYSMLKLHVSGWQLRFTAII